MLTAFLDLDGTLIDPKEGITTSIQYALEKLGADVPHADDLEWCIGPPLWDSFAVLLGEGADLDEAVALYRERFVEEGKYEADVYDGIGEMLMDLQDMGAAIYVATSKPHTYAQDIVEHFGIHAYLDGLFGSELDGERSDKTSLLEYALAETGADPAKCFMLGDRRHDTFGAKNNDIISIGAMWGYGEADELRMAEADMLIGAPEELAEVLVDAFPELGELGE
jgi:phosphoglycolate phosphatase